MVSKSKAQVEKVISQIDSFLATVPPSGRDDPRYQEMLAERNSLAQMIGLPGVDTILSIGDSVIEVRDDISDAVGEIGDLSLNFVRGLGAALVDGVDGAYDAVRGKLSGREPDVIAGITVAAITILTVVFLYNGAKNAKDVF